MARAGRTGALWAAAWLGLAGAAATATAATAPSTASAPAASTAPGATEIAWIWPTSAAPATGYAEAAVMLDSFVLRGTGSERLPRLLPLPLPPGMTVTPVIHVQSGRDTGTQFSEAQHRAVLEAFDRHARASTSGWIQLDFEAPARQREAYLALVRTLRQRLPANLRLSVTVLAAWCAQGEWLQGLAADELVPMLYRLGPDAARWHAHWRDPAGGISPRCRSGAAGYAVQQPPGPDGPVPGARHYWFNERNWAPARTLR